MTTQTPSYQVLYNTTGYDDMSLPRETGRDDIRTMFPNQISAFATPR